MLLHKVVIIIAMAIALVI